MRGRKHKGNIFVGNLPPDFADERLAEIFDPYGIVLSAMVARDPVTGARLRYGFVDIATDKAAKQAIDDLNGKPVDGSKLSVQMSEKPAKKAPSAATAGARNATLRPAATGATLHLGSREASQATFPAAPRKQPTFQVERRPLRPVIRRLTPTGS